MLHTFTYIHELLTLTAFHIPKYHQQPCVFQNDRKQNINIYLYIVYLPRNSTAWTNLELSCTLITMKQLHAIQNNNLCTLQKVGHASQKTLKKTTEWAWHGKLCISEISSKLWKETFTTRKSITLHSTYILTLWHCTIHTKLEIAL